MDTATSSAAGANHHEIGEMDILCSKDKSLGNHPGNRLFREVIDEASDSYGKAKDKASKMKITKAVVECLIQDHGCGLSNLIPIQLHG